MKLVLVDGNNHLFRAFFAVRGMSRSDGMATNAIYGFVTMLEGLMRDEQPDAVAVAFDVSKHTFRNELYPPYKAHRPPMPEDLRPQLSWIHDVVRAFGIPVLEFEGWEADDIIATLSTHAADDGARVTIVSTDKDLMQLVDGRIELLDTMKNRRYGPAEVEEKWGVPPTKLVQFQGLCGDSSDNIPGVVGVGPKGAAKLIAEHGDLEGLYAALDADADAKRIKGKLRENLVDCRDKAFLSRELATLRHDVPLTLDWASLRVSKADIAELRRIYEALEFRSLLNRLPSEEAAEVAAASALSRVGDTLVVDQRGLDAMVAALRAAGSFSFDTETTGLDPLSDTLVGLSFAVGAEASWYVPIGHLVGAAQPASGQLQLAIGEREPTLDPRQLPAERVIAAIAELMADASVGKRAQHAKFDIEMLAAVGVEVRGLCFDPMLADYLLDPGGSGGHGLDALARRWLGHENIHYKDLEGTDGGAAGFAFVAIDDAVAYACEDAQVVEVLAARMAPELEAAGLLPLLNDLELPLELVLGKMERRGVALDGARLDALSAELRERARKIEADAHEAAGHAFNLGSPKQIAEILFTELALPVKKRTRTGPSTDSSVLEQLLDDHPLPGMLLEWRSLTKLESTYTSVLPRLVHAKTGRVHTRFHQAVAATGRLSSTDPNLQNIPIRTEDGRRIRDAFVAAPGHLLISADYSQIELRVLAHLCGDPDLQQAFRDGADVHARTASQLFGVAEAEVSREQRAAAKTVNFGILYGMSATRLAREQQISRKEASALIERYFARYPAIERWKLEALDNARTTGATRTLLGRLRPLPELNSKSRMAVAGAERVAVNTPIQGSAADIIKVAMVELDRRLEREMPEVGLLLQVHDELLLEAPEAQAEAACALCREVMEGAFDLAVPLVVNTGVGRTWLEAH
jgi:DNA polymerase-1